MYEKGPSLLSFGRLGRPFFFSKRREMGELGSTARVIRAGGNYLAGETQGTVKGKSRPSRQMCHSINSLICCSMPSAAIGAVDGYEGALMPWRSDHFSLPELGRMLGASINI